MNDTDIRPKDEAPQTSSPPEKPEEPAAPAAASGTAAPDAAADQANAVIQEIGKENAELRDKLLRALAEMENLRKRTEREVADARSYGISAFARDLLTVADNMRRAREALDTELRSNVSDSVKALLDGVELTERELMNTLEKHGVARFEASGQKFDPNRHQAMFEVEDPSVPTGTVVQEIQAGYTIGERVLRPAMVAVSKGGPKPAPKGEPAANDNPNSG